MIVLGRTGTFVVDREGYHEGVRQFKRAFLVLKLAEHRWSVTRTAAALGVNRTYLQRLIVRLGVERERAPQ